MTRRSFHIELKKTRLYFSQCIESQDMRIHAHTHTPQQQRQITTTIATTTTTTTTTATTAWTGSLHLYNCGMRQRGLGTVRVGGFVKR